MDVDAIEAFEDKMTLSRDGSKKGYEITLFRTVLKKCHNINYLLINAKKRISIFK